jgi:L-arabinose isomerase
VTLFSIGNTGSGRFHCVSSQGEFRAMAAHDISAPQTFFAWEGESIADFSERWLFATPSHHHAAAYGKLNSVLAAAGRMIGVGAVQI